MSERWDDGFLTMALLWAKKMSKDPNTKVASVLVGADSRDVISIGFNGFPMGVADLPTRLADRDLKNRLTVHAERNAIALAARKGHATGGATLYLACTDDTKEVWGGCPCTNCTIEIIQAGIVEIVTYPFKETPSKWRADVEFAQSIAWEAGLRIRYVPVPTNLTEGSFY